MSIDLLWDWAANKHPEVAWSICVAIVGAIGVAFRRFFWPAVKERAAAHRRHAEVMEGMALIAAQFRPNGGSSIADKLDLLASDIGFVKSSLDYLFASGQHPMWRADAKGRITYVSEAVEALTGFDAEQLLGENWEQAIHQDDIEKVRREWSSVVNRGLDFSLKYRICDPQGREIWVHAKARPIRLIAGVAGYLGSIRRCADPRKVVSDESER